MEKLMLTTLFVLGISFSVSAQSTSDRPVTAQPTNRGTNLMNPRPAPPSCCRPFLTGSDGSPITIMRSPASTVGAPSGSGVPALTKRELKAYRKSLKSYLKVGRNLLKKKEISEGDFQQMVNFYNNRIREYKWQRDQLRTP